MSDPMVMSQLAQLTAKVNMLSAYVEGQDQGLIEPEQIQRGSVRGDKELYKVVALRAYSGGDLVAVGSESASDELYDTYDYVRLADTGEET